VAPSPQSTNTSFTESFTSVLIVTLNDTGRPTEPLVEPAANIVFDPIVMLSEIVVPGAGVVGEGGVRIGVGVGVGATTLDLPHATVATTDRTRTIRRMKYPTAVSRSGVWWKSFSRTINEPPAAIRRLAVALKP